jgi:hypothetical protein
MAKKINYEEWSKDELIKEIKRIRDTTYGLVWHRDVPEEKIDILINPDARTPNELFPNEMVGKPFPILKENKSKQISDSSSRTTNILIEGDNKERSAMLKIAPLRKKRYPARGARKKQFPINGSAAPWAVLRKQSHWQNSNKSAAIRAKLWEKDIGGLVGDEAGFSETRRGIKRLPEASKTASQESIEGDANI